MIGLHSPVMREITINTQTDVNFKQTNHRGYLLISEITQNIPIMLLRLTPEGNYHAPAAWA